jgi:hypothetical protein
MARLSRADVVISDRLLDPAAQAALRAEAGELILAGGDEPPTGGSAVTASGIPVRA